MFTACLSNSMEALYAALRRDYQQKCAPFQKRFIAVPHAAFISYLQRRLAEDSPDAIFFGATIGLFQERIEAHELFLFGFSALDEETFTALKETGARGYFLSPTMMYWEDLVSDHKAEFLLEKAAPKIEGRLRELLFDRHPLLANLGAKGRAFFTLLQESGVEIEECYVEREPTTLLTSLQHDLLHLEETTTLYDSSIVMHATLTPLKEVELLFDALWQFSEKKSLNVGDLVVLVEDLERYRPHIERVFANPKSPFSYQILARSGQFSQGSLLSSFLHLLQLLQKRGKKEDFLLLLESEAFCRRWNIEEEERAAIEELVLQQKSDCLAAGDRELLFRKEGIQAVFESEPSIQESFVKAFMVQSVDSTTAQASACFLKAVHLLGGDLRAILSKESFSPQEYGDLLHKLLPSYFDPTPADSGALEILYGAIEEVAKSGDTHSFNEFLQLLQESVERHFLKREGFQRTELLFMEASRLPYPARFLALLNANEIKKPYSVLEALLSAEEQLFISYQSYSFKERAAIPLSRALRELVKAVKNKNFIQSHRLQPQIKNQRAQPLVFSIARSESAAQIIDLALLQQAARNPLKLYFQHALSIQLPRTIEEDFTALDAYLLKKSALFEEKESFLEAAEANKKLPKNGLKQAYMSHFEEVFHSQKAALQMKGVPEIVECSIGKASALQVGKFLVTGSLETLSGNTLLSFGRQSRELLYRRYPDILFLAAAKKSSIEIFSTEDQKSQKIAIVDPSEKLERYIEYTLACCEQPYPVFPEQLSALLQDKKPAIKSDDPYHELFIARHGEQACLARLEEIRPVIKTLFEGSNEIV